MLRLLPIVVTVVLVVYALVDCVRTPDEELPAGMPKVLWIVLIVVFPPFGAVAWIIASRVARSRAERSRGFWSTPSQPRPAPRGPVAPDDDPEFLARLERERRRAERERRAREQQSGEQPPSDESPEAGEDPERP